MDVSPRLGARLHVARRRRAGRARRSRTTPRARSGRSRARQYKAITPRGAAGADAACSSGSSRWAVSSAAGEHRARPRPLRRPPRRPAPSAARTPPGPWCCSRGRGRPCRCRGSRWSRSRPGRGRGRSPAAARGSAASWSWWSTSMPASPTSCRRARVASSGRPRPPLPHGCAITRHPAGLGHGADRRPPAARRTGRRRPAARRRGSGRTPRCGRPTTPSVTRASATCGRPVAAAPSRGRAYVVRADVDAEPAQPRRASPAPATARPPSTRGQLVGQRRVGRVGQVGEQVHAAAVVAGADLHARHQRDAELRRAPRSPRPSRRRCRGR